MSDFNTNRFIPDNNEVHSYVGKQIKAPAIGYLDEVEAEINTVLKHVATAKVTKCSDRDKFIDIEKSHFCLIYISEVEKVI